MSMSKEYFNAFVEYCREHRPSGWALDVCQSTGTFRWFNFRKRSVYATPDWSEDGMVPVDVEADNEEGCAPHHLQPSDFPLVRTVVACSRAQTYLNLLRRYLDAMPDVYPAPLMASIAGKQYVKAHHHERWYQLTPEGVCHPIEDSANVILDRAHAELLDAVPA